MSIVEQGILTKKAKKQQQLQDQVAMFNAESYPTVLDEVSHNQWTNVSHSPSYVVGEQVVINSLYKTVCTNYLNLNLHEISNIGNVYQ